MLTVVEFEDIDGWKAITVSKGDKLNSPSFDIYDSAGNHRANLNSNGALGIRRPAVTQDTVIGAIILVPSRVKYSGRKFSPETELKQAVRYAYLRTQETLVTT